jgi:hypothetical protein
LIFLKKLNLKAYQEWVQKFGNDLKLAGLEAYTANQLFFIRYGQTMCIKWSENDVLKHLESSSHTLDPWRYFTTNLIIF